MNKFLPKILLVFLLFVAGTAFSQQRATITKRLLSHNQIKKNRNQFNKKSVTPFSSYIKAGRPAAPGDCRYRMWAFDSATVLYDDSDGDGVPDGYVVGTNAYADLQKAEYYDLNTATPPTDYINGAVIYFADAYADDSDYTKIVTIRVFDGTGGTMGAELGSVGVTLQEIADSLASATYDGVPVSFSNIAIPASKQIFVSVDMSNLDYYSGDLLAVYSSDWDALTGNTAWEQWEDLTWYAFDDAGGWGGNVSMAILPLLGETNTCTNIVPVKFVSFTADQFGADNKISWKIANEYNCKGFEVERSNDGLNFTGIGNVALTAGSGSYNFIDKNVNELNYYRIKEIDYNGNVTYSNIAKVKRTLRSNKGIVQVYPTLCSNEVNVVVNASDVTKVSIYDISARLLISKSVQTNGANQLVNFNTSALSKGTYIVKLINNNVEKTTERFIKK